MVDYREKIILPYIKNKTVLDLGPGDTRHRFLHKFIANHSKSVIGVELDPKRAENLRKKGYNVITGNAENINLKRKFDVVIAGDLIEHLNNPGIFLENVKKHLKSKGIFICNTPNIYAINLLIRGFLQGGKVRHFPEHTLGFTEQLLRELFKRHNLSIKKIIYYSHPEKNIKSYIIRILSLVSEKWKENFIVIATKK